MAIKMAVLEALENENMWGPPNTLWAEFPAARLGA